VATNPLRLHLQAAIAAFQFLTRIPIPVQVAFEPRVLTRSVIYFPLAGALIGWCTACSGWLLSLFLPPLPAAVLALVIWIALSGALHLDGWMDTADGVLSHRPRERMLEIMKDSRVGAMGVIAAVLLLLLKASLLAELLLSGPAPAELALLAIIPVWSRTWMSAAIAGWRGARQGEGIGALFAGVTWKQAAAALLLCCVCSVLALIAGGWPAGAVLLFIIAAMLLTVVCGSVLAIWLNRKLGGLTGDTYGAMNEAVEVVLLLAAVAWLGTI
jgi:adenosylcobinamide-GDP ribazoletransferase